MCGLWRLGGVLLLMPALGLAAEREVVLVYRGANTWVAAADNKPLRTLMAAAKQGVRTFKVILPQTGRAKSAARLEVLRGILVKSAGGIVLEEVAGEASGGIVVRY